MPDNFNDFGIVKTQEFAERFPAVTAALASQTASENGSGIRSPADVGSAIFSDPGMERISNLINDPNDDALGELLSFDVPDTAGQGQEQATNALFGAAEQNIRNVRDAKIPITVEMMDASDKLDRLSSFNKASYTKKRLKELDPVSDIDQQIMDLRQQMFLAESFLDADPELEFASPGERANVRANRLSVFTNAIGELSQQRNERLKTAQGQIDDEISAHDDQINASIARVNSLGRQMEFINETGKDNEALVSLRSDLLKEQERLRKLRAGAGGKAGTAYSTQKEMARVRLRQDFIDKYGRDPDNEEEQAIDNTVENYFIRAAGATAIEGRKGDENQSVNTDGIGLPNFREPGLSANDASLTANRLNELGFEAEADAILEKAGLIPPAPAGIAPERSWLQKILPGGK